MKYKIVADSCCDMTPDLKAELGVTIVPLTLTIGEKIYTDDEVLNLPHFMDDMKKCQERVGSACPSPSSYGDAFEDGSTSFAVTLSSNLSGSNASAQLGMALARDERNADAHVFDSRSASAGEVIIVYKLRQLIDEGLHKSEIVQVVERFIDNMKTYFVLDNVDNLMKNGRMNKVVGRLVTALNINPVMCADENGEIALFSHARGEKQIIEKMVGTVEKSGKPTTGESMVITHCNNLPLAQKLKEAIHRRYDFKNVLVVPTRGISSLYANDKGIVMAF